MHIKSLQVSALGHQLKATTFCMEVSVVLRKTYSTSLFKKSSSNAIKPPVKQKVRTLKNTVHERQKRNQPTQILKKAVSIQLQLLVQIAIQEKVFSITTGRIQLLTRRAKDLTVKSEAKKLFSRKKITNFPQDSRDKHCHQKNKQQRKKNSDGVYYRRVTELYNNGKNNTKQ